jgi:hypothetical protein
MSEQKSNQCVPCPPPKNSGLLPLALVLSLTIAVTLAITLNLFVPQPVEKVAALPCGLEPGMCPRGESIQEFFRRCVGVEHLPSHDCLRAWAVVHPGTTGPRFADPNG